MQLKTLYINNYRQFQSERIQFDNELTIFAGANNSGKTSIIELFKRVFNDKNFSAEDIFVHHFTTIKELYKKSIKVIFAQRNEMNFREKIKSEFAKINQHNYIGVNTKMEITYDEDESISLYSDYLMELDAQIKSFYFVLNYEADLLTIVNNLNAKVNHFIEFNNKLIELRENKRSKENKKEIEKLTNVLDEEIENIFISSFTANAYFTDQFFLNPLPLSIKRFQALFNFNYIKATRLLNDEKSDNYYSISKELLDHFQVSDHWTEFKSSIISYIKDGLSKNELNKKIEENSLSFADNILKNIEKYFKYNKGDFSLQTDISDELLLNFLKSTLKTYYSYPNDVKLQEFSQGLGISNLIFICLKVEGFIKTFKNDLVNFFIIEEPEAHMHPQMERLLVRFVKNLLKSDSLKQIQGCITTHSNEIIKSSSIKNIRVLRITGELSSSIFDLNVFNENLKEPEQRQFYTFMFSINFSDIVFANKIIMYEGDTEKIYLEKLLNEEDYEKLAGQYISFVQVGGAYSHWYRSIIYYLGIKTLIITDIDYDKKLEVVEKIKACKTITNGGLLKYYKDYKTLQIFNNEICTYCNTKCRQRIPNCLMEQDEFSRLNSIQSDLRLKPCKKIKKPNYSTLNRYNCAEIYSWQQSDSNKLLKIVTQSEEDGFTRTLEEAMLCKLFNIYVYTQKPKIWWEAKISHYNLKLRVPNLKNDFTVRALVQKNEDAKIDFMYSIILANLHKDALPNYIHKGLVWLYE